MLELADRLLPLVASGVRLALATSIDVIGSAPHLAGTSMAVTDDGAVIGSVSGGCVEAAALADCRAFLTDGTVRLRRYGFGDAAAARAGLACGGELDVLVHGLGGAGIEAQLRRALEGRTAALGLVVSGPQTGRVAVPGRSDPVEAVVARRLAGGGSGLGEPDCDPDGTRLFVDVLAPARRMVIGGATETAVALSAAAAALGYRVVVCDPRAAFAQAARFPAAERVVVGRVDALIDADPLTERDAVCLLGHDEDLDPLALAVALESPAGFVGALGSRSTTRRRRERLAALGVPDETAARLHMPIGLDIGAASPAEIAVAILAQVLAVRNRSNAAPLAAGSGPIHRGAADSDPGQRRPAARSARVG